MFNRKYQHGMSIHAYLGKILVYNTRQVYNIVFKLNAKLIHVQPSCHRNTGTQKRRNQKRRDIAYCQ